MAQKELGYVELEWTCKRCGTKNPGTQKVCASCGGPMEANEEFSLPEQQKLIEDENQIEAAKKGSDRQCPYCGARNPADAATCGQCEGDLKGAKAREAGKVLGALQTAAVAQKPCRYCGELVQANAARCPSCGGDLRAPQQAAAAPVAATKTAMPVWLIAALGVLALCCVGSLIFFVSQSMRTTASRGVVEMVEWQRSIAILAEQPVQKEAWEEDVPNAATDVFCSDQYRETRSEPAPKATEVCGTPYTVDLGNGNAKVVQDCEYQVYASYCEFRVLEWTVVDQVTAQGTDTNPEWPAVNLAADQREGEASETYSVVFVADGERYTYAAQDEFEFSQFTPGSEWTLNINGLGGLTSVEP